MRRFFLVFLILCSQKLLAQSNVMEVFEVGQDLSKISLPGKRGTILSLSSSFGGEDNQGQSNYSYTLGIPDFLDFPLLLQLQYSSGKGVGISGYGFELSVPYIQRVLRHGVPSKETALEDSLEGELVEVEDSYLRARIDEHQSRYSFHGLGILKELSNGMMLYYGLSNEAKEGRDDLDVRWWLEKIVDKFGNYISISYTKEEGVAYPQLVRFVDQNDHELYHIIFDYENRPDRIEVFNRGVRQVLDRRLTSVQVYRVGSEQSDRVSHVVLGYNEKYTNRSLLESIQRFDQADSSFYPEVKFEYSEPADLSVIPVTYKIEPQKFEGGHPSFLFRDYRLIDMNADGLIDLLAKDARSQGNWKAWLNRGDSSFVAYDVGQALRGFSFKGTWTDIADIDGDRKLDILQKVGSQPLMVRKSQGKPGDLNVTWSDPRHVDYDGRSFPFDPKQGMWVDLTGNSRVDYVYWQGGQIYSIENQSTIDQVKFSKPIHRKVHSQLARATQWADINGDGLADLYYVNRIGGENSLYFSLNNGQGWVREDVQRYPIAGRAVSGAPFLIDLIGDGIPELVIQQPQVGLYIYQLRNGRYELALQLTGKKMTRENLVIDFTRISSVAFGDITGNSSTNVILEIQGQIYYIDFYMGRAIEAPYLLSAYETSLGERVELNYQSSASSYEK